MQNLQAYLKMIISTFEEQPYETPDVLSPLKPAVNTPPKHTGIPFTSVKTQETDQMS